MYFYGIFFFNLRTKVNILVSVVVIVADFAVAPPNID
jgi:hypothetical protein